MKVPVPAEFIFPFGALALSVEPLTDFDRRDQEDNQARDKESGQRLWVVTVLDLDPQAARFGQERIRVKIAGAERPALPEAVVQGYPPLVAFVGLMLTPWVDDSRCRSAVKCRARLSYSMRAAQVVAASDSAGMAGGKAA